MKIHPDNIKTALVMPGGGARGAFQAGVLTAIAEILPRGCRNPFPIISGTSAGAINSVVLASKAKHFHQAVAELAYVWSNFESHQVFRDDPWTMLKSSLHWLSSIVLGGMLVGREIQDAEVDRLHERHAPRPERKALQAQAA